MSTRKVSSLKIALSLIGGLGASAVVAGTMGPVVAPYSFVATLSGGPVWTNNAGDTQQFYLAPELEKRYVAGKSSETLGEGELFLGIQHALNTTVQGQLGLAVAATSNATLRGVIWDDADPIFDNYTYKYKVQHTHVAVKAKLLADMGYIVTPWLSGSVGVGFNRAFDYTSTPTIFEAFPTPNFASRTQTTFTYTVGAGIQKALTQHWQVGVGYEFADWGKSQLGRSAGQTLNTGLTVDHLYTNGLLFNITWLS